MELPRLHLVELEDLAWFPPAIRDFATDYLQFVETLFDLRKPVVALLRPMLREANSPQVVDLCSGGGGPVLSVYQSLAASGAPVRITLTDKFPNLDAFAHLASQHSADIGYVADPVEAAHVPRELSGVRTMFNAFHHFAPPDARAVLESAVEARQPIAIFEISERSPTMIFLVMFTPIFVLLVTPFIRPFSWKRLFWTYLIPLIPFTCWWDGMVSQFRAYRIPELLDLTQGLSAFRWTAGRVAVDGMPGHVTHLLGSPRVPSV